MRVIQFRTRTHEQVIRFRRIEHHIERSGIRTADRSGRKARVLIRVIRRIDRQMAIEDTLEFEIPHGIFDGRTSLQEHAFLDAVQVQTGDQRHLALVMTLAFYDRCYDSYLNRCQADRVRFSPPFAVPERVILFVHPLEELFNRDIPIYLVRIRNKKATAGLFVKSVGS